MLKTSPLIKKLLSFIHSKSNVVEFLETLCKIIIIRHLTSKHACLFNSQQLESLTVNIRPEKLIHVWTKMPTKKVTLSITIC
jgi:hypothetical protein